MRRLETGSFTSRSNEVTEVNLAVRFPSFEEDILISKFSSSEVPVESFFATR